MYRLLVAALAASAATADGQVRRTKPKASAPPPTTAVVNAPNTVVVALPPDPAPRSCNRGHPGRTDRTLYAAQNGDATTAKRVARHVTRYAVRRYHMEGLVTDAQISAADDKVYNFLKWKLGGPTPVAVTWVSHGFAHFDRAYVDEAAAVLLGYKIPRELHVVEQVRRSPSGKPDYRWAKEFSQNSDPVHRID